MHYFDIKILAVLVAAIIQWVIGALWYGLIFAKPWKALVSPKEGQKTAAIAYAWITSFIANLILCFVLVHIILWAGRAALGRGAFVGLACWLGFMAPPLCAQHIYEGRPFKLFIINAGYWLVAMILAGAVLSCWL